VGVAATPALLFLVPLSSPSPSPSPLGVVIVVVDEDEDDDTVDASFASSSS